MIILLGFLAMLLLVAGYAAAAGAAVTSSGRDVTSSVQAELTKSFSSAADSAQQYPQHSSKIIAGAKTSFLNGQHWAFLAGIIAVVIGAVIMSLFFPGRDEERKLLAGYEQPGTELEPDVHAQAQPPGAGVARA